MKKIISIIIPVLNEEKYIDGCIDSIIDFDYPKENLEIIFVDGNSTDKTVEIITSYQDKYKYIKILNNNKKIVPISMNIGIKESRGEYIVRLDAHAIYPKNYISELLKWSKKLDADNVGAVCLTEIKSNTNIAKAIKFVMSDKFGVGNSLFRVGTDDVKEVDTVPFGFYKREVFKKNGFYNEQLDRVQDLEFNKRLKNNGGKIFLVPEISCTYFPRETISSFFRNRYETGKWVVLAAFITKDLSSISIRHMIPLIFVVSLFCIFLCSLFYSNCFIVLAFILLSYTSILFTRSIVITKKIILSVYNVLSYFVLHISYGIGSIGGFYNILKISLKK